MSGMQEISYEAMRFYWDVLQSLALFLLFVWTAMDKRRQQNSSQIDEVMDVQQDLDSRVQRIETEQKAMPTRDEVAQMKAQIARIGTDMKAQNNLLQTIHHYLLNQKEK